MVRAGGGPGKGSWAWDGGGPGMALSLIVVCCLEADQIRIQQFIVQHCYRVNATTA